MMRTLCLIVLIAACSGTARRGGGGGDVEPRPSEGEEERSEEGEDEPPAEGEDEEGEGGDEPPAEGEGEEGEGEEGAEGEGEPDGLCEDTCGPRGGTAGSWADDGRCDDGGAGSDTRECELGTDCTDCGVRQAARPPSPGEEWDGPVLCEDTCAPDGAAAGTWANDGACDDGGPGAEYAECELGTDCTDCGPRGCNLEHPCDNGLTCREGACVIDDQGLLAGDPPSCPDVPDWRCEGGERVCGEVVAFEPDLGPGWWDYPLNGETQIDQYRSYVRRDVMMLVKYATAAVECMSAGWPHGTGEPLGLGDMSEEDGAIPGTRENQPGHPEGTHVDGHDMDIAYFQVGARDNTLRPVCDHVQGGRDAYHCVGEPTLLDPWRTALFIAKLHDSPQLRVIGVDGKIGPIIEDAIAGMCANGWLDGAACRPGGLSLAYETVDQGRGWYHFHHHHLHISLLGLRSKPHRSGAPLTGPNACITSDCSQP